MIQELLGGGAGLIGGERKLSITGGVFEGSPSSSPPPPTTPTSSDRQSLRCPRCDSSNTKFCYYNNYNLTQPRHFCKTCRRYWTQGGALRNVPIGGGCRKNKNPSVSTTAGKSSSIGKIKTVPSEIGKSNLGSGFDHELVPSNPILWASPQNSQLLALLRATQNPNSISNTLPIKDEGGMIGSHLMSESAVAKGALNARTLSLDPLNQVPLGLCSSLWRNNQHQTQQQQEQNHYLQQQQQHHHGFLLGEVQNSGIQELYQRIRSQAWNCCTDYPPTATLSNAASSSSSTSSILEPPPPFAGGGEIGFWNPVLPWSNLPTTNGAYP